MKDSGRENIVLFGDSISFGELVSPHKTWAARLSARIEEHFGDRFLFVNTSINGNTTRMALDRMAFDVQRYHLDVLIVQFGMNDCNHWQSDLGEPRVSEAGYRANLTDIVARGRRFGAREVFLAASHPTPHVQVQPPAAISYEESRARYCAVLREVAADAGCRLIDAEAALCGRVPQDYLMPDGIHLNDLGHDLYLNLVWSELSGVLHALPRRSS